MAARKPRAARPVNAALQRLITLSGRGVAPARMGREVDAIIAEWHRNAAEEAEDLRERIEEFCEQLASGVAAAEEALSDVDTSDAGAIKGAQHMLAALTGAHEAAREALATA